MAEMARSCRLDSDKRTSVGGAPRKFPWDGDKFKFLSEIFPAVETTFHKPSTLETSGVKVLYNKIHIVSLHYIHYTHTINKKS